MTPPQESLIQFFNAKGFGRLSTKQAKLRILTETIENKFSDGFYAIRGKSVATTGLVQFNIGDRVPVVFRGDEPIAILGHSWRRAQFDPVGAPTVIGDWQNLVFQYAPPFTAGAFPALFLSNLKDTFAIDLSDFGVPVFTFGPNPNRVIHASFCANDPSFVLVVIGEGSLGGNSSFVTLKLLKIQRGADSQAVPTDGTVSLDLGAGPVEFPKVKVEEISTSVVDESDLILHTRNFNIDFEFTFAFVRIDSRREFGVLVSSSITTTSITSTNTPVSGTKIFGIFFGGDFFCVKVDGIVKVFLLVDNHRFVLGGSLPSTFTFSRPLTDYTAIGFDPATVPEFPADDIDDPTEDFLFRFIEFGTPAVPNPPLPTEEMSVAFVSEDQVRPTSFITSTAESRTFPVKPTYLIELSPSLQVVHRSLEEFTTLAYTARDGETEEFSRREAFRLGPPAGGPREHVKEFGKTTSEIFNLRNSLGGFGPGPPADDVPPDPDIIISGIDFFPGPNPYTDDPFKSEGNAVGEQVTGQRRTWKPSEAGLPFDGTTFGTGIFHIPEVTVRSQPFLPATQNFLGFDGANPLPIVEVGVNPGVANVRVWNGNVFTTIGIKLGSARLINEKFIIYASGSSVRLINRNTLVDLPVAPSTVIALDLVEGGILQLMASRKKLYFPAKVGTPTAKAGLIIVSISGSQIVLTPNTTLPAITNPDNFFTDNSNNYGLTSVVFPLNLENS